MRIFGLIGYPLGHSFSKKYFTEKFIAEGIDDCTYENFPIESISLFNKLLADHPGLCGLNVTIPYKTRILEYVDVKEECIDEIGAVNVLKIKRIKRDVKVYGYNSDITGIKDSVLPYVDINFRNALILGTGGSSKAVSYALRKLGLEVMLVSRKRKPGILCYQDIDNHLLRQTDLIVNTTPLGMFPDTMARPDLKYELLNERHILFDLVYNPEMTSFLKMGQERGCRIITGLKMLYSQAEKSWEIWNNDDL
jgi:shikimate dehydrogenase